MENTFFNLLSVQQSIKKELSYSFKTIIFDDGQIQDSYEEMHSEKYFLEMKSILKRLFDYFDFPEFIGNIDELKQRFNSSVSEERIYEQLQQINVVQSALDITVTESIYNKVNSVQTEKEKCKLVYSLSIFFMKIVWAIIVDIYITLSNTSIQQKEI